MRARILPSILTALFIATSGAGGALLHLCGMENAVVTTCCCQKKAKPEGKQHQIRAATDCCGDVMSEGRLPPAKVEGKSADLQQLQLALAVSPFTSPAPAYRQAEKILPSVRGPPLGIGPPLYISNCSYLI